MCKRDRQTPRHTDAGEETEKEKEREEKRAEQEVNRWKTPQQADKSSITVGIWRLVVVLLTLSSAVILLLLLLTCCRYLPAAATCLLAYLRLPACHGPVPTTGCSDLLLIASF